MAELWKKLHELTFTHFHSLFHSSSRRLPTLYWNGFWESQILPSQLNNVTMTSQLHSVQPTWLGVSSLWASAVCGLLLCAPQVLFPSFLSRWLCLLLLLYRLWINSSCVRIFLFYLTSFLCEVIWTHVILNNIMLLTPSPCLHSRSGTGKLSRCRVR